MVVLWTARFAWAKGRNPWLWGTASAGLALLPWHVAAMLPMVLLLFLRARATQGEAPARPEGVICPKCQTRHLASQHFCVNCGWDLAKPYGEPAAPQAAAPAPASEAKPVVASQATAEPAPAPAPAAVGTQSTTATPEQPQPAPKPPRVHRPPTAAGMTERGLALFAQGKVQEAIDQFTKAIALDPSYVAAWQRRAEAYQRLGRPKEAAEDIRRLQALSGSAP